MKTKKYRIPRKLKKQIPKGLYCYTVGTTITKNGQYEGYKITPCPFYRGGTDPENPFFGMCKLVKAEVMDQCKSCGINYGFK